MSGIPLAKSEFKQIQTDLLTELTADLSVDHLDLDLIWGALLVLIMVLNVVKFKKHKKTSAVPQPVKE